MNQDTVKEKLISLGVSETEFVVIFTGKASNKVNGLYKPATQEILLHNKNFKNDNALMFTAIHEFVHHIACTRKLVKGPKAHPTLFWALFHSLLKIAIEKGIYTDAFVQDPELLAAGAEVIRVLKEQVEAQRKLGGALHSMAVLCESKGARFEDYLDRHARIPKATYKAAVAAQLELFELDGVSPQAIELVSTIGDGGREEAIARIGEGQSIQQVRAAVKQGKIIDPRVDPAEDEPSDEERLQRLVMARKKLNDKLRGLQSEIDATNKMIEALRERLPHLHFEDDSDYEVVEDEDQEDFDDESELE